MSAHVPVFCSACNSFRSIGVHLSPNDDEAQGQIARICGAIKADMVERCGAREDCPHRRDRCATLPQPSSLQP